jgi:hypothetical protein
MCDEFADEFPSDDALLSIVIAPPQPSFHLGPQEQQQKRAQQGRGQQEWGPLGGEGVGPKCVQGACETRAVSTPPLRSYLPAGKACDPPSPAAFYRARARGAESFGPFFATG